jgi:hypothetical protein
VRRIAPALAFVALVAGCGDDDLPTEAPSAEDITELGLELDADGPDGEAAQVRRLECGGDAEAPACSLVGDLPPDPAAPVPPDTACTEIYGGPDTLHVEGTLEGRPIEGTFTRENGCEIERFEVWLPILQELFPDYKPGESLSVR